MYIYIYREREIDYIYMNMHIYIQIPARCPLFSSLDPASDYAHSPIVAPQSPPRLSRALRPTQMHTVPSLTPGCRWYALRALSLFLSLRPM